jgi:hypothetical protein
MSGWTEENHKETSVRITSLWTETLTQDLLNMKQKYDGKNYMIRSFINYIPHLIFR